MENEIWFSIKRYPNYLISNLKRVKSVKRTFLDKKGKKFTVKEKILTIRKDRAGNDQVVIWDGNKINYELIEVLWFQSKKKNLIPLQK